MSLKRRTSRKLNLERLESRQMMAGDLRAELVGGTLFINEASGNLGLDQAVQVSQLANGRIRVDGLFNQSGGQTKINGATRLEFAHPLDLVIGTGGGSDHVSVRSATFRNITILAENPSGVGVNDNDSVVLSGMRTTGIVDIRMGAGVDNVFVQSSVIGDGAGFDDLKISTGVPTALGAADQDGIFLQSVTTRSATILTTGASADVVRIMDSKLGNDVNDFLTIKTGAGADTVEIAPAPDRVQSFQPVEGRIVITTFDSATETDVDTVKMKQLVVESARVDLGGGNDIVDMLAVTALDTIQLEGMAGNDTMKLIEVEATEKFFALMGDNEDTLDLTFVKSKAMTLDGGFGFDRLERHQMPFIPSLSVRNWEVINGKLTLLGRVDGNVKLAQL